MKLTCPACGAVTSLEAAANDKAARQVSVWFGKLPPEVAAVLPGYLALFRPQKQGLRWTRVEAILAELVPMVHGGFARNRRRCRPAASIWRDAIQAVADRNLTRPLKNHGYLLEVVADLFDRADARWENERDEQQRQGNKPPPRPVAPAPSPLESRLQVIAEHEQSGIITIEEAEQQRQQAREAFGE